jgi:hypothetical protein
MHFILQLKQPCFLDENKAYHGSKGEDVRGVVEFTPKMSFRAPPIIIPWQHPVDTPAFWQVRCIFEVRQLGLFNDELAAAPMEINHDVVRLDV